MKKLLLTLAAAVAAMNLSIASDGVSSVAFPFVRIERSASCPAGINILPEAQCVSAGWQSWMMGSTVPASVINARALVYLEDYFGIRASYSNASATAYDITNAQGKVTGSFEPSDAVLAAGVVFGGGNGLSIDAGVVRCTSNLAEDVKLSATMIDAHLRYAAGSFNAAAGVSALGWGEYSLPTSADIAASYLLRFGKSTSVNVAAQGEYYFCGATRIAAGAEASLGALTASVGASFGGVVSDYISVGAGYMVGPVRINLQYLTNNTLSVGATYYIGR